MSSLDEGCVADFPLVSILLGAIEASYCDFGR